MLKIITKLWEYCWTVNSYDKMKKVASISRHRIVPVPTPRIATQHPFNGKPKAFDRAVFLQSFQPILRTSGSEPALRTQQRGNTPLVNFYQKDKRETKYFFQCLHGSISQALLRRLSFYPLWCYGWVVLFHCTKKIQIAAGLCYYLTAVEAALFAADMLPSSTF